MPRLRLGRRRPTSEALIEVIAGEIADERRGIIVCGRQPDPGLAEPVAALARATGYPILAEPTSQLRLGPHDRSLVVSAYDAIARARPPGLEPELVLRFGELPTSKALRAWLGTLGEARQMVVDPAYGWSEPTRVALVLLRVAAAGLATALTAAVDVGPNDGWVEGWRSADAAALAAMARILAASDEPTEPGAHAAMGELYADGDIVYTASSMPIRDQETFLASGPGAVRFLANRGANGIDGLVSSGIGAAIASGRPTWILTGDLGLHHDMNALATLRHATAPVRIVVFDNAGGGIFEFLPQVDQVGRNEFEALFGTPVGLDVARVAALYDLPHRRIGRLGELAEAAGGATGLIEVPTERRANLALHRRLTAAAVEAVEGAIAANG
jgi:2-succinyl-5-enolpyruvyl-6-hydroxy-3-cyclohexene-1-carboxylate synthase